ncbi:MAG: glycoside hydrolase [Ruminococcus sp.]|nr:glycoside hydrolase [Ruminococcus sp.]
MNILKYISVAVVTVASVFSVTACSSDKKTEDSSENVTTTEVVTDTTTEPVSEEVTEPTTAPPEIIQEMPVSYPEIQHSYAGDIYEAERERLGEGLTPENARYGYSGGGYVTGFGTDGQKSLKFRFDTPATQHYDLSFGIASDSNVNCRIMLNGSELCRFTTNSDGQFYKITQYGVFLEKGYSDVEVIPENGEIMLDYLDVENSYAVNQISYETNGIPVNSNASDSAKNLMKFLSDNYGKYTLTGQYVSGADNSEIELIHEITGQYPAIRFSAIDSKSKDNVEACVKWNEKGGINGITWEWKSPSAMSSVYTSESDFSIWNAFTYEDISMYSTEELLNLLNNGVISQDCYNLVVSMDEMAQNQLVPLKEKGIPVLWRPLYEASLGHDSVEGSTYWWGAGGAETYKWLWNLMYKRYTDYFELDNLIWVWNGMSSTYSVDSETYDIASYDLYTGTEKFGSCSEQLIAVQDYIKGKVIAVSECNNTPDIDALFRDNSVWSFFGLWNGEYITDGNGNYSEQYTTKDELIKAYNSEGSLTLDEYKLLNEGGQLSVGKRSFSEELKKEYEEMQTTEAPVINYGYTDDDYSNDYNNDYDYNYDYDYDYDYDYNYDYDYDYDYDYSEW